MTARPHAARSRAAQLAVALALPIGTAAGVAQAAEIVLYPSAVDATLRREVFNRNGRYVLSGDPRTCAWAGLDSPATTFRDGRVFLRMRFQASTAVPVNNQCVGGGDQFWVTLSAEPFVNGETVGLHNARLEEGKDVYRPLLEIFLRNVAPSAINVNVRDEVTRMLKDPRNPWTVTLPRLDVQSANVRDGGLVIGFDFRLEAR